MATAVQELTTFLPLDPLDSSIAIDHVVSEKSKKNILTSEQKIILQVHEFLLERLGQFPLEKQKQLLNKQYFKEKFKHYFEDLDACVKDDSDTDMILNATYLPSFVLNDSVLFPNFIRFLLISGRIPPIAIDGYESKLVLPSGIQINPKAGNCYSITPDQMRLIEDSKIIFSNVYYFVKNEENKIEHIYKTQIEFDFLLGCEQCTERCMQIFGEIMVHNKQITIDNCDLLMQKHASK